MLTDQQSTMTPGEDCADPGPFCAVCISFDALTRFFSGGYAYMTSALYSSLHEHRMNSSILSCGSWAMLAVAWWRSR